jgi:hypothetical protein
MFPQYQEITSNGDGSLAVLILMEKSYRKETDYASALPFFHFEESRKFSTGESLVKPNEA